MTYEQAWKTAQRIHEKYRNITVASSGGVADLMAGVALDIADVTNDDDKDAGGFAARLLFFVYDEIERQQRDAHIGYNGARLLNERRRQAYEQSTTAKRPLR